MYLKRLGSNASLMILEGSGREPRTSGRTTSGTQFIWPKIGPKNQKLADTVNGFVVYLKYNLILKLIKGGSFSFFYNYVQCLSEADYFLLTELPPQESKWWTSGQKQSGAKQHRHRAGVLQVAGGQGPRLEGHQGRNLELYYLPVPSTSTNPDLKYNWPHSPLPEDHRGQPKGRRARLLLHAGRLHQVPGTLPRWDRTAANVSLLNITLFLPAALHAGL